MPLATNSPTTNYISSDYLVSFKDFCLSNGIDLLSVMTAIDNSQISPDYILSPPPYIDAGILFQLYQHIKEIADDPLTIAWNFARWQAFKNAHGSLGLAIRSAENFIESAEIMVRFGLVRTDILSLSITSDDDNLYFFVTENNDELLSVQPQASQFIITSFLFNAEIFLRQSLPESTRGYKSCLYIKDKLLKKDIPDDDNLINIYDESNINALQIPLSIAKARFTTHNQKVYERFLSILEKELQSLPDQGFLGKIRVMIKTTPWEDVSIENIAFQLNQSVSTLQRRLRDEHLTFQEIKHQERILYAKDLLLFSKHTLETIAEQLGFSNTSNFSKSFKSSEGISPNDYRHQSRINK